MVKYEIRKGDDTPCKLVSLVTKDAGWFYGGVRTFENFVASGTWTHCNSIKTKLEVME